STFLYTKPLSAIGFWFALEDLPWIMDLCAHPISTRFVRAKTGDGKLTTEFIPIDNEVPYDESQFVNEECKAGTLVLIHGSVLHKSEANRSGHYQEEQQQELEVLRSIYPDELEEISSNEYKIKLEPDEQDSLAPITIALHIKYTPTYPYEIPEISIDTLDGSLSPDDHDKLLQGLLNSAQDSLGMAMIFTLASLLKDELTNLEEQARSQGTRVTVAAFLEWREKSNKEKAEKERIEKRMKHLLNLMLRLWRKVMYDESSDEEEVLNLIRSNTD
ncbi:3350_t:CDS:2, partial [Ambispora leptoticha]